MCRGTQFWAKLKTSRSCGLGFFHLNRMESIDTLMVRHSSPLDGPLGPSAFCVDLCSSLWAMTQGLWDLSVSQDVMALLERSTVNANMYPYRIL